MMRSSVLLPAPLSPMTPIFAPGKNDSQMPSRMTRLGGTTFFRPFIVNTYCGGIAHLALGANGLGLADGPNSLVHEAPGVKGAEFPGPGDGVNFAHCRGATAG